jgi:hypothetical protein
MSNSQMVVADKYRLTEFESVQKGTFKQDGSKELIFAGKIVKRSFVEVENGQKNNVKWIIDEEATARLEEERQKNIELNAEKKRREKMTTADLVEAIAGKSKQATKKKEVEETVERSSTPDSSWKVSEIKAYLDENGIDYSPRHGKDKLIELANENA